MSSFQRILHVLQFHFAIEVNSGLRLNKMLCTPLLYDSLWYYKLINKSYFLIIEIAVNVYYLWKGKQIQGEILYWNEPLYDPSVLKSYTSSLIDAFLLELQS